jgi:very-short-patch-repair endonuclease
MRLTIEQAKSSGVWDKIPLSIRNQLVPKKSKRRDINPQRTLYEALLPMITEAEFEKQNLIPGRKFRADIYLPSSQVVIEVDGFKEHGMYKANFQQSLDRQNIFVAHGYILLRYYTARIQKNLDEVLREICNIHKKTCEQKHDAS